MDAAREKAIEVLGEGFQGSALDLLRMIYSDTSLPMGLRLDAARCAVAYESPKLLATVAKVETEVSVISHEDWERQACIEILDAFWEQPRQPPTAEELARVEAVNRGACERAGVSYDEMLSRHPLPVPIVERKSAALEPAADGEPAASGEEPPPLRPREYARPGPLAADPSVQRLPVRYRPPRPLGDWSG